MTTPLGPHTRLSESSLWTLQRAFYEKEGREAWTRREIPTWITSNAFFARAFARVVLGFLRDLASRGGLDRAAPVYVVELASGSGQFAFHFLRWLRDLTPRVPALEGLRVRYVLTDFTESNLRAWRSHERFSPFLEDGGLDFALFDLERDQELRLLRSGETLGAGTCANPLVVAANYAFDSTLQDCFRIRGNVLYEDLVRPLLAEGAAPDAPDVLARISALDHQPRPWDGTGYHDDRVHRVLESYRQRLGDTSFLLPVGALRCARALLELSRGRLLLLCGDKGVSREEDLRGRGEPAMVRHQGCFSFSVNLHAIGRYFEEAGGFALHTSQPRPSIQVSAFFGGFAPADVTETRQAFAAEIDTFGPAAFHTLALALCEQKHPQPLDVMLAVLKLSAHDAEVLYSYREALVQAARTATPAQKDELRRTLSLVWEGCYPLEKDLAFELARIAFAMSAGEDALRYSEESLRVYGETAPSRLMEAYSLAMLGRADGARRSAERALALDPGFAPATELLERLRRQAV